MKNVFITSRNNPCVKEAAKLADKKYRDIEKKFCFEGRKLFEEALIQDLPLTEVFVTESYVGKYPLPELPCPVYTVTDEVYEKISFEKSPEGIFCVSKTLDKFHNMYIIYRGSVSDGPFVVLDGLRDPGNLGTVLRTASAFGIKKVLMSADCADIYNPKTIRASMGAVFRLSTARIDDLPSTVDALRSEGLKVYGAALEEGAVPLNNVRAGRETVFVIGNEGRGIRPAVLDVCDGTVIIPMESGTESLNAASAATVLLWEGYRASLR